VIASFYDVERWTEVMFLEHGAQFVGRPEGVA
jgi:hypothetical protein